MRSFITPSLSRQRRKHAKTAQHLLLICCAVSFCHKIFFKISAYVSTYILPEKFLPAPENKSQRTGYH